MTIFRKDLVLSGHEVRRKGLLNGTTRQGLPDPLESINMDSLRSISAARKEQISEASIIFVVDQGNDAHVTTIRSAEERHV